MFTSQCTTEIPVQVAWLQLTEPLISPGSKKQKECNYNVIQQMFIEYLLNVISSFTLGLIFLPL